ncbi:MAG: hypothetical protein IPN34_10680 [Planctomycetes bacterium]|nr:hypothetical protein [Planctomycetota bacterium]
MTQPTILLLAFLALLSSTVWAQQDQDSEVPTEESLEIPRRHVDPEVRLALDWLRRHQRPDGLWSTSEEALCGDAMCAFGTSQRSALELSALATLAILSDHSRREVPYRRMVRRASLGLLRQLETDPAPFERGDRAGHFFALLALLEFAELENPTELRERLEPLLAAIDRQRVETTLTAEELYAWISFRHLREMFRPQERRPWDLDEVLAAERLFAAAPDDPDLLALVALTRIFAGESPRSSPRLEALADEIGDERCPRLEQDPPPTLGAALLRGEVAFQLGGPAFGAWQRARQLPLRESQTLEGCGRGAWMLGLGSDEEFLHPLESTVFALLILKVRFCTC